MKKKNNNQTVNLSTINGSNGYSNIVTQGLPTANNSNPYPNGTVLFQQNSNKPITNAVCSTTQGTLSYVNTVGTFNEIVHEHNFTEIMLRAIDIMPIEEAAKLRFNLELKFLDEETRKEYETSLKLLNYDYKTALHDLITTERSKAVIKILESKGLKL